MKVIRIFFWVLIWLFCFPNVYGQTYSSIINDKEIYAFLNYITKTDKKHSEEPLFKRKQIYYKIKTWDTANFVIKDTELYNKYPYLDLEEQFLFPKSKGVDTMFKQADRAFLFQQFISIKDTIWQKSFSNSKLLKDKDQKRPNRYYYSIPLFSIDRKYVIVRKAYYCGSLCAYGGYYIYKRIGKNKWEYVVSVHTWIS